MRNPKDLAGQRVDCGLLWLGDDDRRGLTQPQRVAAEGVAVVVIVWRCGPTERSLTPTQCRWTNVQRQTHTLASSRARWIRWRADTSSSTHPNAAAGSLRPWSAGRYAADPVTLANTTLT